jgi:hypothetical protein
MRFTMPAFRTQAGAQIARRKGIAHPTSTLSASALALSAAFPRSTASFSVHLVFLLVHAVHSPATALTATAAARHGISVALQVVTEPTLNNLAQVARHEWDHLDSVGGDLRVNRSGNRAANQRADTQIGQTKRLLKWRVIRQRLLRFVDNLPRLSFDDVNIPCGVEERRDSIVPV